MPGPETPDKVIGGRTFRTVGLGGLTSIDVLARLGRPLTDLLKAKSGVELRNMSADALKDLLSRPDDLKFVAQKFASATTWIVVDPEFPDRAPNPVALNDVEAAFRGRTHELFEFLVWQVEVNFGDFLDDARTLLFRPAESASSSPPKSPATGSPGDSSSAGG